jgi:catechol 2,3-dioxygenase-like lactoylglutathione lyase family enzyme
MEIQDTYPLIVTEKVDEARDFYVRWLDMEVTFETDWVVYVSRPAGTARIGVCFMAPGLEHQIPEHRIPYKGDAVILTFHVDDAQRELDALRDRGFEPDVDIRDEPWGQRHFMTRDPAGIWVDIVQDIEPGSA